MRVVGQIADEQVGYGVETHRQKQGGSRERSREAEDARIVEQQEAVEDGVLHSVCDRAGAVRGLDAELNLSPVGRHVRHQVAR